MNRRFASFLVFAIAIVIACGPRTAEHEQTFTTSQALTGPPSQVVAAGAMHSCVLLPNETVQCWGDNSYGELGNGTRTSSTTPFTVPGLSGVTAIAGSSTAECALLSNQTVQCWGNPFGASPVPIGLSGVVAITSGGSPYPFNCAVLSNGTVWCWGDNGWGQLGNGSTVNPATPLTPVQVFGLMGAIDVAAQGMGACALLSGGTVQCWGGNPAGQLGIGNTTGPSTCGDNVHHARVACSTTPVAVSGLSGAVVAITRGEGNFTCALLSGGTGGTVQCWGDNTFGELGIGTSGNNSSIPMTVSGLSGVTAVGAGYQHACAVLSGGAVNCWGYNVSGQLGNGTTTTYSPTPVPVFGVSGATAVSGGQNHSCALVSGGVMCWGQNTYGQLGDGTRVSSPVAQGPSPGVNPIQVVAGWGHTCVLFPNGTVQCWGHNGYGELGNGTYTPSQSSTPVTVHGLSGVTAISGSFGLMCALLSDQTVKCWGYGYGPSPVRISNVSGAVSISASGSSWSHACAVLATGTVSCWGDNMWGQLGNGNGTIDTSPGSGQGSTTAVPVSLTGVIAVAAHAHGTCALLSNGTVQCWGANLSGELGIGTTTVPSCAAPYNSWPCSTVPAGPVSGLSNAVAIAAGDGDYVCALQSNRIVSCWGDNGLGQLGDGTIMPRPTPVQVTQLGGVATAIAAGADHSCAVLSSGTVQCWGNNASGELGGSTPTSSPVPLSVTGVSGAMNISAGGGHSCALLTGFPSLQCWGDNTYGQLGNGTTTNPSGPVVVTGFSCAGAPNGVRCGTSPGFTCENELCVNVACINTINSSADTQSLSVSHDFGSGLVTYSQSSSTPAGGETTTTITITLAGQMLESKTLIGPNAAGVTTGTIIYGPGFHGVHEIDTSADQQTVTEVVDGRSVQPLSASAVQNVNPASPPTIVFTDGNPAPPVTVDAGILQAIAAIDALANASLSQCTSVITFPGALVSTTLRPFAPFAPAAPPFEPGHFGNVTGSGPCENCNGQCVNISVACLSTGAVTCAGAATALIAVPFIGIAVGAACELAADALCYFTEQNCKGSCKNVGSACCPIQCGTASCCLTGEACLNTGSSLCCSPGFTPCPGPAQSCVDVTKAVCLPSGAGCPRNVPTCGSGVNQICCPSGICKGNTCTPPSTFGIKVHLTGTTGGPELCTSGTSFTPGATATVTYAGIPGFTGTFPAGSVQVGTDGTFTLTDLQSQMQRETTCTQAQAFGSVTITAQDDTIPNGTGATTTSTVPAVFWCLNFSQSGGSGPGTCP